MVQRSLEKMSEEKVTKVMLMQRSPLPDTPRSAKKLEKQYKKRRKIYKDYESPVKRGKELMRAKVRSNCRGWSCYRSYSSLGGFVRPNSGCTGVR